MKVINMYLVGLVLLVITLQSQNLRFLEDQQYIIRRKQSIENDTKLNKFNALEYYFDQLFQKSDFEQDGYKQDNKLKFSLKCTSCESFLTLAIEKGLDVYREKLIQIIANVGSKVCSVQFKSENNQICDKISAAMAPIVFDNLQNRFLSPYSLCSFLQKCPGYTNIDIKQEQLRILEGKPSKEKQSEIQARMNEQYEQYANGDKDLQKIKVMHISDIHLDKFYAAGAPTENCGFDFCCHKDQTGTGKSGYWGFQGHCDLPERTLDQFISFVKQNIDFDMAVWTGDNISHFTYLTDLPDTIDVTVHISKKFKEAFPEKIFYPVNGNEDAFPDYQYEFSGSYNKQWKKSFSEAWSLWIGNEAAQQMDKYGYYASYNEKLNLKVISLNTLACHIQNLYLLPNPTDPGNMLQFLEKELLESEKDGHNVYIIGHIAIQHCTEDWGQIYKAIIERFSHIIRAQMFGHIHSDLITVYRNLFEDTSSPNNVQFITPSLTTSTNKNPSFRIYEVSQQTMQVLNYQQYRLNIGKYNALGSQAGQLKWDMSYEFLSQYGLEDMSFSTLSNFVLRLNDSNTILYKKYDCNYLTLCHIEGPNDVEKAQKEIQAYYQQQNKYENGNSFYYCSCNYPSVYEFRQCQGLGKEGGKIAQVLNFIEGPWKVKAKN